MVRTVFNIEDTSGIRKGDGLSYQLCIRDEWADR